MATHTLVLTVLDVAVCIPLHHLEKQNVLTLLVTCKSIMTTAELRINKMYLT